MRAASALLFIGCGGSGAGGAGATGAGGPAGGGAPGDALRDAREVHLADIVQLTRDQGENAEAYWSASGRELIFQSTRDPYSCDQIFRVPADGSAPPQLVSTGKGRTTCAYFMAGDERILYSSTHLGGDACPPPPDHSQGYVWALYDTYDIFTARPDGSDLRRLTEQPGYDAEATVCRKDGSIIFTSTRDGDLELYRMDADGSNVVRLTEAPGYDGGAFFSPDCSKIVWRASRPEGEELADYKQLLAQGLVRPGKLELWVANADGSDARQVTHLGAATFAPYFHPSGTRILFSSNYPDPRGREFDIWAIDIDGTNLERITFTPGFDGFPMFSPDGSKLAFASNRNQAKDGQTDVFVARWVEGEARASEVRPADRFAAAVAWLADDEREGRGVGTRGIDAAADWLAVQLKEIGAEPAGEGGYFQPLNVPVQVVSGGATSLSIGGKEVAAGDFVPLAFSAQGEVRGRTVAVGYGIAGHDIGHDDWGKKKAKGKIAVVRRFVPRHAAFKDKKIEQRYGDIHYKAVVARQRGAAGLIVVDAPEAGGEEEPLPPLEARDLSREVGIPVVVVKRAVGQKLLRGSHKVAMQVALEVKQEATRNVVGVVRAGASAKLPGALVVGAHYDHLGMGGESSRDPGVTAPHNGADDNASGTAALLEIARHLVARRGQLARDVYLVAFTAEELGLIGARHFVEHLPDRLTKDEIVGMINLDMVGRMRGNAVHAFGSETADEWPALVEPACRSARIRCMMDRIGGLGPSDHSAFYSEKIPVLYFFTGSHEDYHRTTDDADRIHAGGGAQIAAAAAEVAAALAARDGRLTYRAVQSSLPMGDRRSWRASLGTMPAYGDTRPGVLLDGVRPGGPAEKAGLRKGDRIFKIGSVETRSVHELMYLLQDARPGEQAKVVFEREGKRRTTEVTFGEGRARRPGR